MLSVIVMDTTMTVTRYVLNDREDLVLVAAEVAAVLVVDMFVVVVDVMAVTAEDEDPIEDGMDPVLELVDLTTGF